MRKALALLAVVSMGTSACMPAFYHEEARGRVVDPTGRPIPRATVLLRAIKDCGNVGGGTYQTMKEVVGTASEDGNFEVSATGMGVLWLGFLQGCTGFSKRIELCKDGKWAQAKEDLEGDFIFGGLKGIFSGSPSGDSSGKAREACREKRG